MNRIYNNHLRLVARLRSSVLCITILFFGLLSLPVLAVDVSGHGVTGLMVAYTDTSESSSYSAAAWSAKSGSLSWSDTTDSSGWWSKKYYYKATTLTLTNNSGEKKTLSFTYDITLNEGSVTIDDSPVTTDGKFTKTLENGDSLTIKTQTVDGKTNTTTVNLTDIKLEVQQVTMTFTPSTNGTYTVDGAAIVASTTKTNPSTTTYTLAATPADNYVFAGWYLDDIIYSSEQNLSVASFATSGTVTAKFKVDPLYQQATVPGDSAYTKDQLVTINTRYYHDSSDQLVVEQRGIPSNNSTYSKLAQSGNKDYIDVQYVPSLQWSDSMGVAYSALARGDYVTGVNEESYAHVRMHSDIIRIYAKENCSISFAYTNDISTSYNSILERPIGTEETNYVYTYITTSANASIAQVKGGTKLTSTGGSSGTISLSKGSYLYILAESYVKDRYLAQAGTTNFSYSASISNFAVSYNEKKDILSAGFRDNTGAALGSGKITVNNASYAIGSNGNMSAMEFADLATVELKVGATPANYVHIGWAVTANGTTSYYYTPTYTRTLTEDVDVIALFVPKMTVTMGSSGYSDATYTLFDGTAASGQYVARNADSTKFYTTLAEGFADTNVVVLLAGDTVVGDWEIPSGKTLVIPYGLADKGSTTPVSTGSGIGSNYCLVTLDGNLTVNGTLLVSAQQYRGSGTPGGPLGHLSIVSGKKITVNGALYSYGPITGSGTITANSAAEVHEYMEAQDNSPVMYVYNIYNERSSKKVFPFNALFFNNIEVPVTYQSGATLIGHTAVTYDTVSTTTIQLIDTEGAMLNCSSGSITKYYDEATGQFVFRINEKSVVETGSFSISLAATVAGTTKNITIDSAEYYIPLAAPYRFEVAGSLTFNGNYKFLPGAKLDVQDGGTVTIASGSNLVFYRMNDYDNRGRHSNSTEQWGYSAKAYPSNPTRFPGVSYSFSFTADNVGSAKLNVDGTLIVNGGLYVTDELRTDTANGIVIRDNGYNNLTGFGSIDMTSAQTSLGSINEVMTATGTNDLVWDTVAVTPMKGLKADATKDEAAQYESLSGIVYGITNTNSLNVWSTAPTINFRSIFLSIKGETLLNLSFRIPKVLLEDSGAYVVWTEEANAVVVDGSETKLMLSEWTPDSDGLYTLSQGIASGEMTGDVTVRFFDGNGNPRWIYNSKSGTTSASLTQTVLDYVTLALASDKAELKAMCNAMLTFGGYAQRYFGVDTGNLAYSLSGVTMPDISKYDALDTWSQELVQSGSVSGISYKSQRLGLDSKVYMTTYFTLDAEKSIEDYTFTVSYMEGGQAYSSSVTPVADGDNYSFKINDIPPAMWDTVFTVTITNNNDASETCTITCSVLAWARRCIENSNKTAQVNMAKAMYYFNETADAYFGTD